jgi:hypothetical protein
MTRWSVWPALIALAAASLRGFFALLCETNKRLEDPAPEGHLRRIAESVCQYAPGDKRGISYVERDLRNEADEIPIPEALQWPAPIDDAAYYGLARAKPILWRF